MRQFSLSWWQFAILQFIVRFESVKHMTAYGRASSISVTRAVMYSPRDVSKEYRFPSLFVPLYLSFIKKNFLMVITSLHTLKYGPYKRLNQLIDLHKTLCERNDSLVTTSITLRSSELNVALKPLNEIP